MEFDLVFEGGGAKGAVFIGAMEEFESRGHTSRRFVGTSAGAITAAMLAAGYDSKTARTSLEQRDVTGRLVMSTFLDVPERFEEADVRTSAFAGMLDRIDLPFVPNSIEEKVDRVLLERLLDFRLFRQVFSFLEKGGLYEGMTFYRWMTSVLDARGGLGGATFAEFHEHTGNDLSVIASDTDAQAMLVLNHRTAPACPVTWGVRMSMSIPFVWQEVHWRGEWGPYMGRDVTGHTIVDGGVLSNFPMHLVTTNLAEVVQMMGDADPLAVPNLGFLIDEELPVDASAPAPAPSGLATYRPIRRFERLVDTMLNARDRAVIEACMKNDEVCRLPAGGYSTTDFDMDGDRFEALVTAGRVAARAYFDRRFPRG
jgi:predicted acylesterase/phospholipase RssA